MNWFILFSIISILIFLTALYVAAEFSAVSTRRSRLTQIANKNNRLAQGLLGIIESPVMLDRYVATCQIGITVTSLLLGYIGQEQLTALIGAVFTRWGIFSPVVAQSVSATTALLGLTAITVVIGELVPKNVGIQYPERLAILTAIPMRWSMALFRPMIWFFNGSGQLIMRLFGQDILGEHAHVHSPDEIVMLVEESSRGGVLRQEERRLLKNTLELRDSIVREVMIPRPYMLAAPDTLSCNEFLGILVGSPYSRLPIYRGTIDNIVGVMHLKDLLCLGDDSGIGTSQLIRSIPFVPETTPVKTVFSLLQRRNLQVAIVLDEFGGTAGMVTLEDLIEEIFGELQDEFDTYVPSVKILSDDWLLIRGDTLVSDVNEWFDLGLPEDEVDTMGGLVLNELGRVPASGDAVEVKGVAFQVDKLRGRGITAVRMAATPGMIRRVREAEA